MLGKYSICPHCGKKTFRDAGTAVGCRPKRQGDKMKKGEMIREIQRNLVQTEDDLRKAAVNIHKAREEIEKWRGTDRDSNPTRPRSSS